MPVRHPARVSVNRDDGGAMALWLLGLAVVLLAVGGISLDLWRVATQRRMVAAAVDAAASVGAGALDVEHLRATGEVLLDPVAARAAAEAAVAQLAPSGMTGAAVTATPTEVTVAAEAQVPLTLLRLLVPDAPPVAVRVEAMAVPRASP